MSFKLIIAGSRDFTDYRLLCTICDTLYKKEPFTVISGGARGADSLAERYTVSRSIPFEVFMAKWNTHGKKAGYIRNQEMAKAGDRALIFWDGKSRGTQHMIHIAKNYKLPTIICYFNQDPILIEHQNE